MAFARSAATAALGRNVCTQCRRVASLRTFSLPGPRPRPRQQQQLAQRTLASTSIRYYSTPTSTSKLYDFHQIQKLVETPSKNVILIDVREPSEYAAGYIPTAINIPIKSQPDAMFLPGDEFEERFGFSKPAADQEVVFYCKSGVRSNAAAQLAQQIGYTNVAEYRGSWLDWEKNGGSERKA